jgi:hypothetical protein
MATKVLEEQKNLKDFGILLRFCWDSDCHSIVQLVVFGNEFESQLAHPKDPGSCAFTISDEVVPLYQHSSFSRQVYASKFKPKFGIE